MMNDYRTILNIIGWALAAVSTLFVVARVFTRTQVVTMNLGWDDWCMVAGLVSSISLVCLEGVVESDSSSH